MLTPWVLRLAVRIGAVDRPGPLPAADLTDIDGPVVKALRAAAWDILRGIDAYPEKTRDHVHFAPNGSAMLALGSNCTSDA